MFEHLLADDLSDFLEVSETPPMELVGAQATTLDWMDAPTATIDPNAKTLARQAFANVTNAATPTEISTKSILALRAPEAVRHLVSMLSAYDWAFVEHAAEMRGYVVAKLLDETKAPDSRTRLAALKLIGSLTEVGSFTERVEVIHKTEDTSVIEERIRARLAQLLPPVQEVQDAEVKEIAVVRHVASVAPGPEAVQ